MVDTSAENSHLVLNSPHNHPPNNLLGIKDTFEKRLKEAIQQSEAPTKFVYDFIATEYVFLIKLKIIFLIYLNPN